MVPLVATFGPTDILAVIQSAVDTLGTVLGLVAPVVAVLGASVIALMFGWKLFKRFIH